ncbi:hypothetical protein MPSD_47790 [Mycobacterium pseudoshottsii JCM 15466]|uniref:Uncharacterized protein n=1 Tax=Mycobacterium pseudoshottsii TaxID=265949 RepID=A0A9N7LWD4_9MYCO|nr:hypothetical protein MPSD_47790 [Mycobacterium pseudoshottsii JCM 15466]BDN84512.1 hypothetical protein NJB1907Z4_C47270 [Mycobacterium pseudoshottsii]
MSAEVTEEKAAAADPNSPASPSQAAAADNSGPDPAPLNIRAEFISGGDTEKLIAAALLRRPPSRRPPAPPDNPTIHGIHPVVAHWLVSHQHTAVTTGTREL